jgi:hypothetical protein
MMKNDIMYVLMYYNTLSHHLVYTSGMTIKVSTNSIGFCENGGNWKPRDYKYVLDFWEAVFSK